MDVIRGTEIYAVELGDKRVKLKKEPPTQNLQNYMRKSTRKHIALGSVN